MENNTEKDRIKDELSEIAQKHGKINVLITGSTGCGKSSTINALFGSEVAKVGITPDPETMGIDKYDLPGVVLWDSPGLGDGKEKDKVHAKNIISKLRQNDKKGHALIDVVLVIVDGSSRDLGTSYELINKVIIPNFEKERIIVAINKADNAMGGREWDFKESRPNPKLQKFLEDKEQSVRERIKTDTDVDIWPISYSAGYKADDDTDQEPPYNLLKLLHQLYMKTPIEKRIGYVRVINQNPEVWNKNENPTYGEKIKAIFIGDVERESENWGKTGEAIGEYIGSAVGLGKIGKSVGRFCGKVAHACKEFLSSLWPF